MNIATIIMIVGIVIIIISMFLKDKSNKLENDLEELSINIYQETNALKRRIKTVEEELLVEPNFQIQPKKNVPVKQKDAMETFQQVAAQVKAAQAYGSQATPSAPQTQATKPINGILVSQVLALNEQGLSIEEISKRSTLTHAQIQSIIATGGRL